MVLKVLESNRKEIELLILYGSATSEAMFDYPCHFFRIPRGKGVIAYRIESSRAVVMGEPLCPPNELIELTCAFHIYCRDAHLHVIYIGVSEKFVNIAQAYCPISIEVCEELIFDPQKDLYSQSHRLKQRMNKAVKHGLTFFEYIPSNPSIENALLEIGRKWQKARKSPSLHLGHLNFFQNREGKRWFYVKDNNQITSLAMLSRLDAHQGWLLKFFFTLPGAYSETSEFLMLSLLDKLKKENCQFLTKGVVPLDALGKINGVGWFFQPLHWIYNTISFVFKFKTHKQYWSRYDPKKEPSYLLFSRSKLGIQDLRALFKVLTK